ncbi:MAG: DUF2796 domain-containing protein [Methylococcales bacterium]
MSQIYITRPAMFILIFLSALTVPRVAGALGPHVHGEALLQIAIDQNEISIDFDSPLDNLLGFEHAPANEQQRQAVKTMVTRLQQADKLFIAPAAALCSLQAVKLTAPVLPKELLATQPQSAPPAQDIHPEADEHSGLEATITLRCAKPEALFGLEIGLFKAFPLLKRLHAEILSANGQTSVKLNPSTTHLTW